MLRVENLCVTLGQDTPALRGLEFELKAGEILSVIGESGSGKSLTALALMGLLPQPALRVSGGHIWFEGRDLAALSPQEMRMCRGRALGMIFQEPMSALNPVHTIGAQLAEALTTHMPDMGKGEIFERVVGLLAQVHIPDPQRRLKEYPHNLSGGMRQRVMIAMALACKPRLLIADEPTTALDVTIQAQILDLLLELVETRNMGLILITHDLGVVSEMGGRGLVMYAGRMVETAAVAELLEHPKHPYTAGLLRATMASRGHSGRLYEIPGRVPGLRQMPPGCAFAPRCEKAAALCRETAPPLLANVACHLASQPAREPNV